MSGWYFKFGHDRFLPHAVYSIIYWCQSQWPCGLTRGSAAVRLLGLRVRISPRILCVRPIHSPKQSYRARARACACVHTRARVCVRVRACVCVCMRGVCACTHTRVRAHACKWVWSGEKNTPLYWQWVGRGVQNKKEKEKERKLFTNHRVTWRFIHFSECARYKGGKVVCVYYSLWFLLGG
jgi:hypothetical protein